MLLIWAGAVFALAGLVLMMRPRPGGTTAKLELFGLKVEAGSAGVMAFPIGSAFLAAPIVVPERSQGLPGPDAPGLLPRNGAVGSTNGGGTAGQQALTGHVPVAITLKSIEAEPDNTLPSANLAALGSSIQGRLEGIGSLDLYAIAIPAEVRGKELVANLTNQRSAVFLTLTDELGTTLDSDNASVTATVERGRYHIMVENGLGHDTTYQLMIGAGEPEVPRN
jgi:hypothetical protein